MIACLRRNCSNSAAEGAHHVAVTKDERFAFVQNSLLNLLGMSDGSIAVIDLVKGEAVGSINTLKDRGFNPNSIVVLPQWNPRRGTNRVICRDVR
jgi:hypothetical protein